jgi:asparaginyl-tRNA synthetase
MSFIQISDVFSGRLTGKEVSLRGWIYRKRDQKDVVFLILRDSSGVIQLACKGIDEASKVTIESSVEVKGTVKEDKRAPGGFEIQVKELKIIGLAEKFPISKDLSDEFIRDVRHLWVRSRKLTAIFKIRSKVFEAIDEYFHKKGFYETHSPILLAGVAESGPDLFEVDFFDRKVYLTQTWQLYAECLLPALEKIYTITPAFRAERSRTVRHLSEYWTAEAEAAWYKLDDCIKLSEELISHVCQKVVKECKKELEFLERDPKYFSRVKPPFPRITYDEALKILEKDGIKIKWGKDLRTLEEKKLMEHYDKPLVVTHYPKESMAFYKPRDPKNPKVAVCYDILCPEMGIEIVGGSERDLSIEEMKKSLIASGEDPQKYEFYFDTRRYGSVPHSGFGLGIERLIMWITGTKHIMDTIPFPRTMDRVTP